MTLPKRLFDLTCATILTVVLAPVMLAVALAILVFDGRPVLYVSERMKGPATPFRLVKFRTMTNEPVPPGVSGGDTAHRITRTGRILRRAWLDEMPQLWNVFRGDMSFVGPRPPLRVYVERFPALYAQVLRARPGLTGLASIYVHEYEDRLLARSTSAEETDRLYARRLVPRKARLDILYLRHRSVCFDIVLMLRTVFRGLR